MLLFHCAEWMDVLRLCIVNDGPEATSSILGHRSNKLSRSFWICMDGLKLPMKTFSCVVSKAFSVSLSDDSLSVLLHWSTVSFPGNQMDLSLWADTNEFQDLSLHWVCGNSLLVSLDIVGADPYCHILHVAFSIMWFSTDCIYRAICSCSVTFCSFKLCKNGWTFLRD